MIPRITGGLDSTGCSDHRTSLAENSGATCWPRTMGPAQREHTIGGNPALVRECAYDGKTALHFCRSTEVAEVLLTAGAEIDAVDDSGCTPLQWINNTGRYKAVCRYLIAQGQGRMPRTSSGRARTATSRRCFGSSRRTGLSSTPAGPPVPLHTGRGSDERRFTRRQFGAKLQ